MRARARKYVYKRQNEEKVSLFRDERRVTELRYWSLSDILFTDSSLYKI